MKQPRVLVAGIGNIFFGDDAFGVEVARRLSARELPDGVRVVDFGIRSLDLAYAILDNYDLTILVDATPRGQSPGTLYAIEPEVEEESCQEANRTVVEAHSMDPVQVLRLAKSMDGHLTGRILLIGCEPEQFTAEAEGQMGLSRTVQVAADRAVLLIESLVTDFLNENAKLHTL
ncbi:MAG: hydrogenase maturation protease [Acidobacteriota bacterium]